MAAAAADRWAAAGQATAAALVVRRARSQRATSRAWPLLAPRMPVWCLALRPGRHPGEQTASRFQQPSLSEDDRQRLAEALAEAVRPQFGLICAQLPEEKKPRPARPHLRTRILADQATECLSPGLNHS